MAAPESDVTYTKVAICAGLGNYITGDYEAAFKKNWEGEFTDQIRSAETWISKRTGVVFSPLSEDNWTCYNDMVKWLAALGCIKIILRNQSLFTSVDVDGFAEVDMRVVAQNMRAAKNDIDRDLEKAISLFLQAETNNYSCVLTEVTE